NPPTSSYPENPTPHQRRITMSAPTLSPATPPVTEHPDFLLLDSDLSAEDIALRDRIRAFGQEHILPIINEYWERAEFPMEVLEPLADLGIVGTFIQGYGCPGLSRQAAGIVA